METAKLSSKSQITVPRNVREKLRVGRGDRIRFEPTDDGRFIVCKAGALQRSDGAARRRLRDAKSGPFTDIAEAIQRTVAEDDQRIRSGR
ncbi:MAG TPA: AbrB/MazE/SpoVT family DNA-binding domain-containing protein [Luteolibacter sp.]|nr:AbrB/MazE/SpoVT family DNA-binding domain-containing protein [Luteolibacter sp.]